MRESWKWGAVRRSERRKMGQERSFEIGNEDKERREGGRRKERGKSYLGSREEGGRK